MPDFVTLTAAAPLGGYAHDFGVATLAEITDMALISIAVPKDGSKALTQKLHAEFGAGWPKPTQSTKSSDGSVTFLGLQADMVFASFAREQHASGDAFMAVFDGVAYCTEQSDAWVNLKLSGSGAQSALERICPLNLSVKAMPIGTATRTVMEHLGVIIFREAEDVFTLMSATSSAHSFLHIIETSIKNTL